MRDVNLSGWEVTPSHTYFMHLQNGCNADAVGLVLVQIGDGSEPCLGLDSHPNDNYDGHVFAPGGKPRAGIEVQYFRDKQWMGETLTDALGRHTMRLSPGCYQYRFLFPGEEEREWEILVKPGHRVTWESVTPDGDGIETHQKRVQFIAEELVCQWDCSDGDRFQWLDVIETVVAIAAAIGEAGATLRLVSFAQFCRPDVIEQLKARGVWASETGWRDQHFAAAFRNLIAVASARPRLIRLKRHAEANYQLERNVQFDQPKGAALPTRIVAPDGAENYLALARAAAVYHASTLTNHGASGVTIFDPASDGATGTLGRGQNAPASALDAMGGASGFGSVTALPLGWSGTIVEQQWNPRA